MKCCVHCNAEIPAIRLEILPNTDTCVSCSDTPKMVGFMDWGHKTAPELVMINPTDRENFRRAARINSRSR